MRLTTSVQRYGPGEEATGLQAGDFILARRRRPMSALISLGERRRFRGRDALYAHWSHCAVIVDSAGGLVESETRGVITSPISKYRDNEYHVVLLGPGFEPDARDRTVRYARSQVGAPFGYAALVGAAIFLLAGRPLRLVRHEHLVCSGLVTRALQAGGLLAGADASAMLPADLAKAFDARP